MVAECHVKLSARRGGLALQAHQQIQHLARVLASIEVAGAHQMRPAAGPVEIAVHDANRLEQLDEVVVGAVYVGKGDHALDAGERHLCGLRGSHRRGGLPHQRATSAAITPPTILRTKCGRTPFSDLPLAFIVGMSVHLDLAAVHLFRSRLPGSQPPRSPRA